MTDFDDDDITDAISSFESAVSARHQEIPRLAVRKVLTALDGSNQDVAALALAAEIAPRIGAPAVHLTYAYEGARDPARDDYLADRARQFSGGAVGLTVTHSRAGASAGETYNRAFQQILHLAAQEECGLIATVAPYLDDFAQLGTGSTGTTLDMLLRHRRTPVLVVRKAFADTVRCLNDLVVPLNLLGDRGTLAVAWALRLVTADSGGLHLLALVDSESAAAGRSATGKAFASHDLDERELAGLVEPEIAGLVAAAQKRATDAGIACRVSIRIGQPVDEVVKFARALERSLIVTGCPEHCSAMGYLRVQAVIRESFHPVLVV